MKSKFKYLAIRLIYIILSFLSWITNGLRFFSKRKIIIGSLLLGLTTSIILAQDKSKIIKAKGKYSKQKQENEQVMCYFSGGNIPMFPGGDEAMVEFISKNMIYPDSAKTHNIEGKVVVKFTVDSAGSVINPIIIKGIGYGCDEEVIRIIKLLPKFNPAMAGGSKVKSELTLPIIFKLNN